MSNYSMKPHSKNPKKFYLIFKGQMIPFERDLSHKEALSRLNILKEKEPSLEESVIE